MRRLLLAMFVALMASLPLFLPDWLMTPLNFAAFGLLVVLGLYLLTGLARMTSFGQAAFMGIAAYSSAFLTSRYGLSPWLTLFVAVFIAAAAAALVGLLTVRLKGHYLPLSTIAWQISIAIVFGNLVGITGGHSGLGNLPAVTFFGLPLRSSRQFYYLAWAFVALATWAAANLTSSRSGRAMRALRGDAVAAAAFGVHPAWLKLRVFVLAGAFAGVAGWLYAHFLRFVNPTPFSLEASITYLIMGVVGGIGSLPGVFLGTGIVITLEESLKQVLPRLFGRGGNYELIGLGLVLVAILLFAPKGLWVFIADIFPKAKGRVPQGEGLVTPAQHKPVADGEVLLELCGVSKAFGGLLAVNDLSFQVRRGEIVGLIGPNGAGKTTSFNLITGVLPPSSGEVRYQGQTLSGLPLYRMAAQGLVRTFQHPHLFKDMTVLENAALGTYSRSRAGMLASLFRLDRREEARILREAYLQLQRVGLADVAFDKAGNLPLGKQRLLEIARALAADPQMLLLDEPAAGLRGAEKRELAALVRALAKSGITILFVDHDMDLLMNLVDRVVVMHYGEKLAEGSPRDVQRNAKVIEAYLGSSEETAVA